MHRFRRRALRCMADGYQVGPSQENIKTYRMYPKLLVVFKDLSTSDSASNDMVQGTGGIYESAARQA
jgi:hypothetical protein